MADASGLPDVENQAVILPDDDQEYNPDLEQEEPAEVEAAVEETEEVVEEPAVEEQEPETEVKEDEEKPAAANGEAKAKGSRAQERIQALNTRAKAAEESAKVQAQRYEAQLQSVQQQFQHQLALQQQALEQQLSIQHEQLQMAKARLEEEAVAKLSPEERLKRQFYSEAAAEAKKLLSPELDSLKSKLAESESARQRYVDQAQRQKQIQGYISRASTTNAEVFKDVFADEGFKKESQRLEELNLTYATALGIEPEQAAKDMKSVFDAYFKAKLAVISKSKGAAKVAQNKNMPKSVPGGKASASSGINWPTRAQLQEDGIYDSQAKWFAAGMPALRTKR